jgi:uncharacterized protein
MVKFQQSHKCFEWNTFKNLINLAKHGVSFEQARAAFEDPKHAIINDWKHGGKETRYYCFGSVNGEVLTVCFCLRHGRFRIYSAGYWREGKKRYEEANQIYRRTKRVPGRHPFG